MRLYQYWDTGAPPADVAACIETVRAMTPGLDHRLLSRDEAARFIQNRLGARTLAAFEACAVPAMQADYFRLCALWATGGLWIDADTEALSPLDSLLASARRSLMLEWDDFLGTGVMLFRSPGDAFVGAYLELATLNIEARLFSSPVIATGPMLADALRALLDPKWGAVMQLRQGEQMVQTRLGLVEHIRPLVTLTEELTQAYRAMTIRHTFGALTCLRFADLSYKRTPRHWSNWRGSIYTIPSDAAPG